MAVLPRSRPDVLRDIQPVGRYMRWSSPRFFLIAVLLNLAPLLYFRYLPSNDGPSHVYNAAVLRALLFSSGNTPIHTIFELNPSLPPNLLTHSLLAIALGFANPVLAERALVLFYAILFPVAFRWLLRTVSKQTHGLEYVSLVLVYNSHLHWGFYNFLFSLLLFMLTLVCWVRTREQCSWDRMILLALSCTLLYFTHPVGLFEYWIVASTILMFEWIRGVRRSASDIAVLAVSSIFPASLYAHYALTRVVSTSTAASWPTLRYAASLLLTFSPLASYSIIQRVVAALVLVMVCLGWWCATKGKSLPINGYFAAAWVTAGLMIITPTSASGGTMISPRLVYFPVILLFVWLVSQEWKTEVGSLFVIVSCVLAVAMLASNWPYYLRYDSRMKEFERISDTWSRSKYISFYAAGSPSTLSIDGRTGTPLLSGAVIGYSAVRNGQVILGDYEAKVDYFPLTYRENIRNDLELLDMAQGCYSNDTIHRWKASVNIPFPSLVVMSQGTSANAPRCESPLSQVVAGIGDVTLRYFVSPDAAD